MYLCSKYKTLFFNLLTVFILISGLSPNASATVLKVGGTQLPANLGNPYTAIGVTPGSILGVIFDGLTQIDENGTLQPALATSWTNDGHTKWTFKIRENVVFHNGVVNSSQNVADNLNNIIKKENRFYPIAIELKSIKKAISINADTVEIHTNQPDPMLAKRLSLMRFVDFSLWESIGADEYARLPVGTGPYELVDWNKNGAISLTAHLQSWRPQKNITTLKIFTLKDPISRTQALLSGQIDMALGLTPEDINTLKSQGKRIQIHNGKQVMAIALPNTLKTQSPLNYRLVRQAINHAVDRKSISEQLRDSTLQIASQGATPANVGYNKSIEGYPYDINKAQVLMKKAGYSEGFKLTIEVLVGMGPSDSLIYQKIAQDLKKIGIMVTIKTSTYPERTRKYFTGDWGNVDAFSILWNNAPYNDTARALETFSCLKNNPFFCDAETSVFITNANLEMNEKKRQKKLESIMLKMHHLAPSLNIIEYGSVIGYGSNIHNIIVRPVGIAYEDILVKQSKHNN